VEKSNSLSEVMHVLNLAISGDSYKLIKRNISGNNIDTKHFLKKVIIKTYSYITPEILVDYYLQKDTNVKSTFLKRKLLKFGLKEDKCEICGIEDWNGKYIVKQLHHKNKNPKDNRLENLQILCPNCHIQQHSTAKKVKPEEKIEKTCIICSAKFIGNSSMNNNRRCCPCTEKTEIKPLKKIKCAYCGKIFKPSRATSKFCSRDCKSSFQLGKRSPNYKRNTKPILEMPTKEELTKLVWEYPDTKLGPLFNASPSTISNWCNIMSVERPPLGYWNKGVCRESFKYPSKKELEKLVWEKSLTDICKNLGITRAALCTKLDKLKIKRPNKEYWVRKENK